MGFANEVAVEISGTGKVQADADTPQPQVDLTLRLNALELRPFTVEKTAKDVLTCNRRGLQSRRTLTRLGRQTLRMEATPKLIALFFAYWAGTSAAPTGTDPLTHAITMSSSRVARYFTMRVGFDDGTTNSRRYYRCAVASIKLNAAQGTDAVWTMDVEIVSAADYQSATGTTWGTCYAGVPSLLSEGAFTINGTDYQSILQTIECIFASNFALTNDPFVNSVDAKRFRKGNLLGYQMTASVAGDTTHALYTAGAASSNNGTAYAVVLRIGAAVDGITFTITSGYVSLAGDQIGFFGDLEESSVALVVDPLTDPANALTPVSAAAVLPLAQQTPAFLVSS